MKKMLVEDYAIGAWQLAGMVIFATLTLAVAVPTLVGLAIFAPPRNTTLKLADQTTGQPIED